jgi:hypothetical protein
MSRALQSLTLLLIAAAACQAAHVDQPLNIKAAVTAAPKPPVFPEQFEVCCGYKQKLFMVSAIYQCPSNFTAIPGKWQTIKLPKWLHAAPACTRHSLL